MSTTVNCPHCKKEIVWNKDAEFRPFCSERCRLQDLGAWFTEERAISGEALDASDERLMHAQDKNDSSDLN